ncbi:MAG: hypothetical protein U1E52_04455 [Geminicoccaceae bacterium]
MTADKAEPEVTMAGMGDMPPAIAQKHYGSVEVHEDLRGQSA